MKLSTPDRPSHARALARIYGLALSSLVLACTGVQAGSVEPRIPITTKSWSPGDPIEIGSDRVILDLSARARFEFRDNTFDFNSASDALTDDAFVLERVRLGLTITATDWLVVRMQAQSALELGSARPDIPGSLGAEGDDPIDVRLFSFNIGNDKLCPFSLEVGRQTLNYGDQRLIGAFEWNNIGRVFDAAVLRWKQKSQRLDLFTASAVVPEDGAMNQSFYSGGDLRQTLSGVYYTNSMLACQTTDLYALWQSLEGGTDFVTLGARCASKPDALNGFDYGLEGAFQVGQVNGYDLLAGAVHGALGYTWDNPWKPHLALAYDYGTGDDNLADGDVGTFQNLYPTNHLYYGYMDAFSWQNINSPSIEFSVKPTKEVTFRAAWHVFWLASTRTTFGIAPMELPGCVRSPRMPPPMPAMNSISPWHGSPSNGRTPSSATATFLPANT